jgi:hypothetical protein
MSPKGVFAVFPAERSEARRRKESTATPRLERHLIISWPTIPVAPMMAKFMVSLL